MQLFFEIRNGLRLLAGKPAHELAQEEALRRYGPICYTKSGLMDTGKCF